ncbi:MAG: ribonuclease H-like domain-containing protein [Pseudanabaenaceae cyanobacterium SKYGB_i_bin29]|nr:ribonuclease H-like domain-containing protein [Pseudanabaenaceae cyanobacterium SKYG29]MDW8420290.1 ribonuclease H-like domain-containing protein [Pseudanabaenaceae cyanobacterium SKYGB_i_bin29]
MTTDINIFHNDLPAEVLQTYLQSPLLAVDTETMGLIPRRDRLCLVQMGDVAGRISLVKLDRGVKSAPNLQQLMEAENVLKIFHYARFDIGALKYHLGIQTRPFFCTKIASKLARTYSPKHGLKELVRELEKVELDKTEQSSDWGNAYYLSEEQIAYAANDVRYLISIYHKLVEMLKREERYEYALACCQFLPTLVDLDLLGYEDIFSHQ